MSDIAEIKARLEAIEAYIAEDKAEKAADRQRTKKWIDALAYPGEKE